jgi:hypothetical protein
MTPDFEYMNDNEADRIAVLENRAAELERRLLAVLPPGAIPRWGNVATPDDPASGPEVPEPDADDEDYADDETPGPAGSGPEDLAPGRSAVTRALTGPVAGLRR